MEGTYRGNLATHLAGIWAVTAAVVLLLLLLAAPDEELMLEEIGIPDTVLRLFLAWGSLLGLWIGLWLLTERVEIHGDRIAYSVCGLRTVVRYQDITFFLPKVLKGFRKRISRGLYLSDACGNTIFVLGRIKRLKDIADYIAMRCDSPRRRPSSIPTNLRITLSLGIAAWIPVAVGALFILGVL